MVLHIVLAEYVVCVNLIDSPKILQEEFEPKKWCILLNAEVS